MNSRLSPAYLFYPLALVLLSGAFFFPSPLFPIVIFYALLIGTIWCFIPQEMEIDQPRVGEMAPVLFLLLFMALLTQALNRPTTETLFHTVRGLILFRTLVFVLTKIRVSPHPISRRLSLLIGALVFEMAFVATRVYHLINPLEAMPGFLPYVEMKLLAVTVAGLMLHAYFQKSRSRPNHT